MAYPYNPYTSITKDPEQRAEYGRGYQNTLAGIKSGQYADQDYVSGLFNAQLGQAGPSANKYRLMKGGREYLIGADEMEGIRQALRDRNIPGMQPLPNQSTEQNGGSQPITTMPVSNSIMFERDASGMPLMSKFKGPFQMSTEQQIQKLNLSPWMQLQLENMKLQETGLLDQAAKQAGAAQADAWSALSRRGGLRGGNDLRLANQLAKERMLGAQDIRGQQALARSDLAQKTKLEELAKNLDIDKANMAANLDLTRLAEERDRVAYENAIKKWVGAQLE
jgi:hypothetical protein